MAVSEPEVLQGEFDGRPDEFDPDAYDQFVKVSRQSGRTPNPSDTTIVVELGDWSTGDVVWFTHVGFNDSVRRAVVMVEFESDDVPYHWESWLYEASRRGSTWRMTNSLVLEEYYGTPY